MCLKIAGLSKISLYCCNMFFQFLFTVRKILGKKKQFVHIGKILVLISQNSSHHKKSRCSKQAIICVKLDALLVDSCLRGTCEWNLQLQLEHVILPTSSFSICDCMLLQTKHEIAYSHLQVSFHHVHLKRLQLPSL